MKTTNRGHEIEYDAGPWIVTVEHWAIWIRLSATQRHESGRLELLGVVFLWVLDANRDAETMAKAVIAGECLPAVLADWVEDHPELWANPGEVRTRAAGIICEKLRQV